jgi:N-methylhydantoinase A/oxoprolinase/acetone carboxylase beta subunit
MRIGINVGSTQVDAVILSKHGKVVAASETVIQDDETVLAIKEALVSLIRYLRDTDEVRGVFIGATSECQEVKLGKGLAKTGLIRLNRYQSQIQPLMKWPKALSDHVVYTQSVEIGEELDWFNYFQESLARLKEAEVEAIAVVGAFSPMDNCSEQLVKESLNYHLPSIPVTMSHTIGSIGFLERENAAVLNALLSKKMKNTLKGVKDFLSSLGFHCPLWVTRNGGCLMTIEEAIEFPVLTLGSDSANSFRGGAFLAKERSCIVVHVSEGITKIGTMIQERFEESHSQTYVFGIPTNLRMPHSIVLPLGEEKQGALGHDIRHGNPSEKTLREEVLISERKGVSLAERHAGSSASNLEDQQEMWSTLKQSELDREAMTQYVERVNDSIEELQIYDQELPIVVVGSGAPCMMQRLQSQTREVVAPFGYQRCHAVGACLGMVSAEVDQVYHLKDQTKAEVIEEAKEKAIKEAERKGAFPDTISIEQVEEYPFDYLQGEVIRIRVKAVGQVKDS